MHPAPSLLGRTGELETLRQLLAGVRGGRSAVVVVRGEAGIGKTELLRVLVAEAAGFRVCRATGIESEMELAYAGLHQLCAPLLDRLESLAEPQRRGLSVAFGLESLDGDAPDRFLVALAALGLMAEAAEDQPLLCVVDDAQWLDQASAQVLGFAGRRLLAEPVALVFADRAPAAPPDPVEGPPDPLAGLPELRLDGLDAALAVLELGRGLEVGELAGGFALPDAGDLPRRIEDRYLERLRALPADARRLLLLVAADPLGDVALILRAAQGLGLDLGVLEVAAQTGLLDVGATVRFRHPLMRSAVYRAAEAADRRAWHRAHAAAGPDEAVAGELISSAGRALRRGGIAACAAFLERAVALTPDAAERAARALVAADTKYAAGDFVAAQALLVTAEVGPLPELGQARIVRMRAEIAFALRRGSDAPPLLLQAAQRLADLDPELARRTYIEAMVASVYAGRLGRGPDPAELARAARLAADDPGQRDPGQGDPVPGEPGPLPHARLLLRGLAVRLSDGYRAAAPLLKEALAGYRAQPQELDWLCVSYNMVAMDLWDDQAWFELAAGQVRLARTSGTLSWLPFALDYLAELHTQAGELSQAAALLAEGERIDPGIRAATLPYVPLLLAAWRGDAPAADELAGDLALGAANRGEGAALTYADYAMAVLNNGLGRYDLAADAAQRASAAQELVISPWALYELTEAAARGNQRERAAAAADRLTGIAEASGTCWARRAAARSRALVAAGPAAELAYQEAIELLEQTRMATHAARARLSYGEWLRRENRRIDARRQLRLAFDALTAMGVQAFAERARRELQATGERVRKRNEDPGADLTPQEQEIARLAREGRTNSEIGAQLFIGARTVEWHLRKVFTKLDIGSRRELDEALRRHELAR